ncbi:universal stress protein [Actinomycetota bacterium Odt1-20B]
MLKPIVVGVDGSRESAAAAAWAAREAQLRDLPLRLVHAWEGLPPQDTDATLPELQAPQYWARRVLRSTSEELLLRHPKLYISTEQIVLPPAPALLAEAASAELLVLGNQGLSSVGGMFAGSVAMTTVAHTPRPVALVRAECTGDSELLRDASETGPGDAARAPYRDVALAVDPRTPCEAVLEYAFHAAELRGAPLRIVHAWHVPLRHGIVGPDERAVAKDAAERELAVSLRPWRDKFPDVFVRELLVEGRPSHHVIRAARGAGLLVVGRRTRRTAIGSHAGPVTHAVVHHVSCPVVVVPHA